MSEPERLQISAGTVYRVPKVCKSCGLQWEGNSFRPAPTDGSRVRHFCDDCITKEDEARKARTAPVVDNGETLDPTPPRKVFGYDD